MPNSIAPTRFIVIAGSKRVFAAMSFLGGREEGKTGDFQTTLNKSSVSTV
jgi:hypothetical protein